MGGKKKPSLKQLEKMQRRKEQREREKQRKMISSAEKRATQITPPEIDENLIKDLKRMKVLTPYTIASRFDLRLSVAKDFLEELHQRGIVTYVSGGRNIKIYKPA